MAKLEDLQRQAIAKQTYQRFIPLGGTSRRYIDTQTGEELSKRQFTKLREEEGGKLSHSTAHYANAVKGFAKKHDISYNAARGDISFRANYHDYMRELKALGKSEKKLGHMQDTDRRKRLNLIVVDLEIKTEEAAAEWGFGDTP